MDKNTAQRVPLQYTSMGSVWLIRLSGCASCLLDTKGRVFITFDNGIVKR